jgi:hypothetical protein
MLLSLLINYLSTQETTDEKTTHFLEAGYYKFISAEELANFSINNLEIASEKLEEYIENLNLSIQDEFEFNCYIKNIDQYDQGDDVHWHYTVDYEIMTENHTKAQNILLALNTTLETLKAFNIQKFEKELNYVFSK